MSLINAFENRTVIDNKIQCILSLNSQKPWATNVWIDNDLKFDKLLCEFVYEQQQEYFNWRVSKLCSKKIDILIEDLTIEYIDMDRDFFFYINHIQELIIYKDTIKWCKFSSKHYQDIKSGTFMAFYYPEINSCPEMHKRYIGKLFEFKYGWESNGEEYYLCVSPNWNGIWVYGKDLRLPWQ